MAEPNWRDLGINPFHQLRKLTNTFRKYKSKHENIYISGILATSLLERIIRHISFLSFKYGTEKIELKFVLEYLMSPHTEDEKKEEHRPIRPCRRK